MTAGSFRRPASFRLPPLPSLDSRLRRMGGLASNPAREQRLEIGAGTLRLGAGNFGGVAEAEIAVDEAGALMMLDPYAGSLQRPRIGCAFVAQRIEPGGGDDRGRNAGER